MQLIIQPSDRPSRSCPYLLSIALVLSFMQYFWPLESKTLQLIPLAVLLASGYVAFVDCCRKARLGTAVSAVAPIMGTTVLATLISHFVATEEAMLYGILMLVVLAASRFILTSIGFKGVLAAYHWASMASLMIAVIAGLDMIRRAAQGKRLELLAFHPNLIAFTLVSFAVVQVWGWKAGGRLRWFSLACACVSTWLLLLTNSRGSLGGLVAAGLLAATVRGARSVHRRTLLTRGRVLSFTVAALLLVVSLPFVYTNVGEWYYSAFESLELNSQQRGLHSGLSGRMDAWSQTVEMLGDGSWIEGHGFRASDDQVGTVDNGYLVLVYDCGVLLAIVVVARYAWAMWYAGRIAIRAAQASQAVLPLALCCLLCAFLTNNVVDRYLFGYGNPFSLLGLFFAVSHPVDYAFQESKMSRWGSHAPNLTAVSLERHVVIAGR